MDDFGALMGRLSDPFVDRAAELAAAGLDASELSRISDAWSERFARGDAAAADLADRFSAAYQSARTSRTDDTAGGSTSDPRFVSTEPQAWRAEAAAVPLAAFGEAPPLISAGAHTSSALPRDPAARLPPSVDETCAAVPILSPVLPFEPMSPVPPAPPSPSAAATMSSWLDGAADDGSGTVELRIFVARPATPFEPAPRAGDPPSPAAPSPAAAPPGVPGTRPSAELADADDDTSDLDETLVPIRTASAAPSSRGAVERRLIYFDPQTGARLDSPRWVDVPKKPGGP